MKILTFITILFLSSFASADRIGFIPMVDDLRELLNNTDSSNEEINLYACLHNTNRGEFNNSAILASSAKSALKQYLNLDSNRGRLTINHQGKVTLIEIQDPDSQNLIRTHSVICEQLVSN